MRLHRASRPCYEEGRAPVGAHESRKMLFRGGRGGVLAGCALGTAVTSVASSGPSRRRGEARTGGPLDKGAQDKEEHGPLVSGAFSTAPVSSSVSRISDCGSDLSSSTELIAFLSMEVALRLLQKGIGVLKRTVRSQGCFRSGQPRAKELET